MANAAGVVDLEASADTTGRVVTYSIEMGQRMLDKVVFEQLHAVPVQSDPLKSSHRQLVLLPLDILQV